MSAARPFVLALDLLRLGRWEGPVLGTLLVPAGYLLAGGAGAPAGPLLLAAALVGMGGLGFAYGLNGVTDVMEDGISKGRRPLPSGRVSRSQALAYLTILAIVTLAGALLVPARATVTSGVLAAGLLGVLYSAPPLRLKRWPPAATLVTAALLHVPLCVGVALAGAAVPEQRWLSVTAAVCCVLLPLKDIEDRVGDAAAGLGNWAVWLGARPLLWVGAAGALTSGALALLVLEGFSRSAIAALHAGAAAVILFHLRPGIDVTRVYPRLVRTVLLLAALVAGYGLW